MLCHAHLELISTESIGTLFAGLDMPRGVPSKFFLGATRQLVGEPTLPSKPTHDPAIIPPARVSPVASLSHTPLHCKPRVLGKPVAVRLAESLPPSMYSVALSMPPWALQAEMPASPAISGFTALVHPNLFESNRQKTHEDDWNCQRNALPAVSP